MKIRMNRAARRIHCTMPIPDTAAPPFTSVIFQD